MFQRRVSRLVYSFFEPFDTTFFGSGGLINLLCNANSLKIVAAVAVHSGVTAGGVVHTFFTAADCTQAEILGQEAISAFLAVEDEIFGYFFRGVKQFIQWAFLLVDSQGL